MELVGNLKKSVEKATTVEEKRHLIEDAGVALTDEELDSVVGGAMSPDVIAKHAQRSPFDKKSGK